MGGTLVYRNQIGVDVRYANAGKWKKIVVKNSEDQIPVADSGEMKVNQMKLVVVGDIRIAFGRTENGYVAFQDRCTHRGGSLAAGTLICGTVQCPWHGSQFDTKTGEVTAGPAKTKIRTYSLVEENGKIYLLKLSLDN
jgi:nitrite reductase/ring-hydroxylating ferredoxin subunit